jgi:hypothetical protein
LLAQLGARAIILLRNELAHTVLERLGHSRPFSPSPRQGVRRSSLSLAADEIPHGRRADTKQGRHFALRIVVGFVGSDKRPP